MCLGTSVLRFRVQGSWKSRCRIGRPAVPPDGRSLIRSMSEANPLLDTPRIHGELLKLGIDVSQATVATWETTPVHQPRQRDQRDPRGVLPCDAAV